MCVDSGVQTDATTPNNVGTCNIGRALQMDPTLLRYASAITEQKKCWELLAEKFDRFQTLRNNMQQGVQTDATCNIQQCCVRLHGALQCSWSGKAPIPGVQNFSILICK